MKYLKNYNKFNEDANSTAGTAGMGDVVNAQPGQFVGTTGTDGSGDVSFYLKKGKRKKGKPSEVSDLRDLEEVEINKIDDELESVLENIFSILESDEPSPTFEWDLTKKNDSTIDKLKDILSRVNEEKVKEYFIKFISKLRFLSSKVRRKVMITYASVFMSFLSIGIISSLGNSQEKEIVKEFVSVVQKSSFDISQKFVSIAEGGYSDDKNDTGNWLDVKNGKRFIGTKYGVSAQVLKEYLGKIPTKEDMMNLSYKTVLNIYKKVYWDRQNIRDFNNQSIANIVYDGCINQGINGMRDVLRKSLNDNNVLISDNDNPFNNEWISQMNELDQSEFFNSIQKNRELRYKNARTFKHHGNGWLDRLSSIKYEE